MTVRELNYRELLSSSSVKTDLSDLLCKACQARRVLSVTVAEVTRFNSLDCHQVSLFDCCQVIDCSCVSLLW